LGTAQPLTLRSSDGSVLFVLHAQAAGLYVKRSRRLSSSCSLVQSAVFGEEELFSEWCDADSIRFEDPLLWSRLRSEGRNRLEQAHTISGELDA
jgi:hypothetical protein